MRPRRWGRLLTLQGALLLIVSFSLPAFHGCSETRVPGKEVARTLADTEDFIFEGQRPFEHLKSLGVFLLPYASALIFLLRIRYAERGRPEAAHALVFFFLLFAFICFEFGYGAEVLKRLKTRGLGAFATDEFYAAIGPLPLVGLFLALRHRARGHEQASLVCQLALAIAVAGFFLVYTIWMAWGSMGFRPRYGIFVSDVAGLSLVAGTILEWRASRAPPVPESVDPRGTPNL